MTTCLRHFTSQKFGRGVATVTCCDDNCVVILYFGDTQEGQFTFRCSKQMLSQIHGGEAQTSETAARLAIAQAHKVYAKEPLQNGQRTADALNLDLNPWIGDLTIAEDNRNTLGYSEGKFHSLIERLGADSKNATANRAGHRK